MEAETKSRQPLSASASPPHVLMFPAPAQGHINPMLKLAELLCTAGIQVTFLTTDHSHRRLTHHSDVLLRFARFPQLFQFRTITDGLPPAHPRIFSHHFLDIINSFTSVTKPLFTNMLLSAHFGPHLTCIILDGFFRFLIDDDVHQDQQHNHLCHVPLLFFHTASAAYFWAYFSLPTLFQQRQLPIQGNEDMDRMINNIPGMENVLRYRDLPGFCRTEDQNDPFLQFHMNQLLGKPRPRLESIILNSFQDLEGPILSKIRTSLCPNVYTIGPLHALLKTKLTNQRESEEEEESLNNLWKVDRSCLAWLDAQSPGSVLYVSFGSLTMMGNEELMEFWHGLVNSGRNFLWVVRPDLVTAKNGEFEIPSELEEGTRKRGYIVEWAPQEKVLAHEAVGGFLTHGGWNSTLESIVAGKPMICCSNAFDQHVNSRFVSHVWKLGLDMKDMYHRQTVANMVNDLMVTRRDEFVRSAAQIANLANQSVSPGGSSCADFHRLVEYITSFTQNKANTVEN